MNLIFAIFKLIIFFIEDLVVSIAKHSWKIILISVVLVSIYSAYYLSIELDKTNLKTIRIEKNITFSQLTNQLFNANIITNKTTFKLFSQYFGFDKRIKPGEYEVPINTTTYNFIKYMLDAKPVQRKVTIIEGMRYANIVPILAKELDLDSLKLVNLFNSKQLLKQFNIPAESIEGYIFPQTYQFTWGMSEYDVLAYLINETTSKLDELYDGLTHPKYTKHEFIIMASIIDAESNFADEMSIVSSVYHNRLNKGWKLQADPTIIYMLGKPQRVLFRHLEIDNPYNTYMYEGLPKGPINSPGIDAIKAAMFPDETTYMYFVGTGDGAGRHLFARSLREHNRNRKQLDDARKRYRRK